MINPAPYNAEAPPEALAGDITPTELHYVRSNFAVPDHDGTLEIGGAVDNPLTLTLDDLRALPAVERAVTLECAGNGRLDDEAAADRRAVGRLRRLHRPLDRRPPAATSWSRRSPAADGVDVRFEGADHGAYHLKPVLADTDQDDLTFVRALPLAHAADPAAEILIAYEMNGEPLQPDHGAPFRLDRAALVRRRLGEVAEAHRRAHRALRRRVPDRPLHLRVARPAARARHPDARPRPDHRPGPRSRRSPPAPTPCAARPGPAPDPSPRSTSASPAKATGTRRSSSHPRARTNGRTGRSTGKPPHVGRHTLRARATDAAGNVQPDVPPWNRLGYGNNAIEVPYVDVR